MFDLHRHTEGSIVIRAARPADQAALARIAARDSAAPPAGQLLVAEVGGELRAAVSLADGRVIADPFHRTAELVDMLRIRAASARGHVRELREARRRALRPRLALRQAA